MGLEQPQSMPLPDEIAQHLENAKNEVTLLEIEATRLQKLVNTSKDTLSVSQNEKKNIDAQVLKLNQELSELIDKVAAKTLEFKNLETALSNSRDTLTDTQLKNQEIINSQTAKSRELDLREGSIQKYEEDLNKRNIDLLAKETAHNAKVEKLKSALE